MVGVNYVTNDEGEKTAILIDLVQLKKADNTSGGITTFMEDLDDLIAAELSKGQTGRPYSEVRKEIIDGNTK